MHACRQIYYLPKGVGVDSLCDPLAARWLQFTLAQTGNPVVTCRAELVLLLLLTARQDAHAPAAGSEVCGPGIHPCLHQGLPEDPGLVPRLRLHAVEYLHGGGDDTRQVFHLYPFVCFSLLMLTLSLKLTFKPASVPHSIIGCRLPEKEGSAGRKVAILPSAELPVVWNGQEASRSVRKQKRRF